MRLSSAVLFTNGTWCREQKNVAGSRKFWVGQCHLAKEEGLVEDMVWEERVRGGAAEGGLPSTTAVLCVSEINSLVIFQIRFIGTSPILTQQWLNGWSSQFLIAVLQYIGV